MITIPRALLVFLGALFSAYHAFLAIVSLDRVAHTGPVVVAVVLYLVATAATLWPTVEERLAGWIATLDLAVAVALPLLVTPQLDPRVDNGYATWYVAAIGTLMTIAAVRRRVVTAWVALAFLAAHTALWDGLLGLATLGVLGDVVWVGIAVVAAGALSRSARETQQFAGAEREAADWQAAQDAHLTERAERLAQTSRVASPMLRVIARSGGELSDSERLECRYLEGAIRDEIRGRRLLDARVRTEVMAARRRGTVVTLLDEGGIDDLDGDALDDVRGRLASAVCDSRSDRLVVRTVPRDSAVAVTVVGIRSTAGGNGGALGDDDDDELDLFLEIPRPVVPAAPAVPVAPAAR